jgi:hypothetical protein
MRIPCFVSKHVAIFAPLDVPFFEIMERRELLHAVFAVGLIAAVGGLLLAVDRHLGTLFGQDAVVREASLGPGG